jgi:hypothetical protein
MNHLTKITAFTVLLLASLLHLCLLFAREVIIRLYERLGGGTAPLLPLPTQFSIQAVNPTTLLALTTVTFLSLILAELFAANERPRFVTQLACVTLWCVIATFCLWAFLLPLAVPRAL